MRRAAIVAFLGLLAAPACFAQTLATTVCSAEEGRLSIQYIAQTDDEPENYPDFPLTCRLGKTRYKVDAQQGPFSERRCGAQPPWTMTLSRNGRRLIRDVVFGFNCFGGAALYQVEVQEKQGRLSALRLCIATDQPDSEVRCRDLAGKEAASLQDVPLTQEGLYKVLAKP